MSNRILSRKTPWSVRRRAVAAALAALAVLLVAVAGGVMLFSDFGSFGPDDPAEDRKWAAYGTLNDDVYHDDLGALTRDLDRGMDPNKFPNDGYARQQEMDTAALTEAAGQGRLPMIKLLLDQGADPNVCDGWDGTPLMAAASNDRVDVMALLVARGAKMREDTQGDSQALWRAAVSGKLHAVRFCLSHGANPNMPGLLAATVEEQQDAAANLLRQASDRERLPPAPTGKA